MSYRYKQISMKGIKLLYLSILNFDNNKWSILKIINYDTILFVIYWSNELHLAELVFSNLT